MERIIWSHHKINDSTGWSLLLFVPYQEILSFSQENFRIILFFDILLMILLGAIVTYVSKKTSCRSDS